MGSRGIVIVKGVPSLSLLLRHKHQKQHHLNVVARRFTVRILSSVTTKATNDSSSLPPPDVSLLAQTARISLSPHEVEQFAPKIRQVIDWFGQLQAVDLDSVEPAIRADTEGGNLRDDKPELFENREAMVAAIPSYEEPYIKVPKVLNKE